MNDSIDFLVDLIRTKSVSSDISAVNRATQKMKARLEAHGIRCVVENINGRETLYASLVPGRTPDYLFNAHLDVVPALPEQFEPVITSDGYMIARGCDDCLGSAVAIADALIAMKDKNASCGAVFSTDEEIGGYSTEGMVKLGYGAKKAIVIIDAGYADITVAQKGVYSIKLTYTAKEGGGHSSVPWCFENPIDALMDIYLDFRSKWKNPTKEDQWHDSMAATMLSAGSVHNQIPDSASMVLNCRYIEPDGAEKIREKLMAYPGLQVDLVETCPPVVSSPDEPVFQKIQKIYQKYLPGREIPLCRMNGATDARYFSKLGVPVAILGVDGCGAHSKREVLKIDSLAVITSLLIDLCTL